MSITSNCGAAPFEPPRVGYQAASGAASAASSGPSVSNLSATCPESGEQKNTLKKITSSSSPCESVLVFLSKTIRQNTPVMSKMIRFLPPKAILEYPRRGALFEALEKISKLKGTDSSAHPVMRNILSFLKPREVTKATRDLSSGWGSYKIDDLFWRTDFPLSDSRFSVIDEKVWVECFGKEALNARGLIFRKPPFIQSINDLRERVRALNKFTSMQVEHNAGFTLMTLPDGLTLKNLIELAEATPAGHQKAVIDYIYKPIKAQYGDVPVEGGVVAISNGLLRGSRDQRVANQRALVERYGCQIPRVVEAVALCLLTYTNSFATGPVRLLNDWSATRCIEQITFLSTSHNLVVGCFTSGGLRIDFINSNREGYGVVALLKL